MGIGETTWPEVIRMHMEDSLQELGVSMPGIVVSYDRASQTAHIKPGITRRLTSYTDRDDFFFEDLPDMYNVPVIWPAGTQVGPGSSYFHPGLEPGAGVLVICSDADFNVWRRSGKKSDPSDARTHHFAHSFALPGLNPKTDRLPNSNVVVAAGGVLSAVAVAPTVKAVLDALVDALNAPAAGGPRAATVADFTAVATALQSALTANNFFSQYIKTGDV